MKKRKTKFLSDFIVNQYPVEDFKQLIFVTLDIVENFLLTLEDGFNYDSITISSYGEKYGNSQINTNSKVESICIKNMKTQKAMEIFLQAYFNAYKSLDIEEKNIFDATFIDGLTDLEIIDKFKTHSKHIRTVRKSAIVRFTLKAGLDKFVDIIKESSL